MRIKHHKARWKDHQKMLISSQVAQRHTHKHIQALEMKYYEWTPFYAYFSCLCFKKHAYMISRWYELFGCKSWEKAGTHPNVIAIWTWTGNFGSNIFFDRHNMHMWIIFEILTHKQNNRGNRKKEKKRIANQQAAFLCKGQNTDIIRYYHHHVNIANLNILTHRKLLCCTDCIIILAIIIMIIVSWDRSIVIDVERRKVCNMILWTANVERRMWVKGVKKENTIGIGIQARTTKVSHRYIHNFTQHIPT